MKTVITKSGREMEQEAGRLAEQFLRALPEKRKRATVVALEGELGAGKTTFTRGWLRELGVKRKINSPTFVLMKRYGLDTSKQSLGTRAGIKNVYHLDAYRLRDSEDLEQLNFKEILSDPENLVLVEWPERVRDVVPRRAKKIKFEHLEGDGRRIIY